MTKEPAVKKFTIVQRKDGFHIEMETMERTRFEALEELMWAIAKYYIKLGRFDYMQDMLRDLSHVVKEAERQAGDSEMLQTVLQ